MSTLIDIENAQKIRSTLEKAFGQLQSIREDVRLHRFRFWNGVLMFVFTAVSVSVLWWVIRWQHWESDGFEPFHIFAGVSIWPAVIIRWLAVVLAVGFLFYAPLCLRRDELDISRSFGLPIRPYDRQDSGGKSMSIRKWKARGATQATELWTEYQRLGKFRFAFCRILFVFLAYFAFGVALFMLDDIPSRPFRGWVSQTADFVALSSVVLLYMVVTFYVMDVTRRCRKLIVNLSETTTQWPAETAARFRAERGGLHAVYLEEWIEMQFIAKVTESVGKLIFYPFVLLFLMLLARSEFMDHWGWPRALLLMMTCNLILAFCSAITLQLAARRARQVSLESLEAKSLDLRKAALNMADDRKKAAKIVKLIQKCIKDIRKLHTGAFASFWENAVMRAVLLPSGSYALLQLLAPLVFERQLP
jgi:hypothetical protein